MSAHKALATAVALADYVETFSNEVPLENIMRLAEALERFGSRQKLPPLSPERLGRLIASLPARVLRELKISAVGTA